MELSKAERKLQKAQAKADKELDRLKTMQPDMGRALSKPIITILCVRFGNKYGVDYVERLRNMIARHTTVPYELVCLTDDPTPVEGVRLILRKNEGYAKGWWHKVHMFDPQLPIDGRILYMDLDVVICSNIDRLTTLKRESFLGIRDFNRKFFPNWKKLNSSVMAWNHRTQTHIWTEFKQAPMNAMRMHGDQDWIWKTSNDRLEFWPEEWIQSYKWEIRKKEELVVINGKRQFREIKNDVVVSKDCCIAVFHGEPNPCEVRDSFVLENWK